MDADEAVLSAIAAKLKNRAIRSGAIEMNSTINASTTSKSPPTTTSSLAPDTVETAAEDAVMINCQDGPPLRGTKAQLQEARASLNMRVPRLRHTQSSSGIGRRSSAHTSTESRRYHPQMHTAANSTQFSPSIAQPFSDFSKWPSSPISSIVERPKNAENSQPKSDKLKFALLGSAGSDGAKLDIFMADGTKPDQGGSRASETSITTAVANGTKRARKELGDAGADASDVKDITKLQDTVAQLQRQVFELSRSFEHIIQVNEKRMFLGTDHAKTPYELSVAHGDGKVRVQADAAMKVSDLIRRIRHACEIAPEKSLHPRIMFEGNNVGHGMILGEVGITSDKEVRFTFRDSEEKAL